VVWSDVCNDAFIFLKNALVSEPVLAHFNIECSTIIEADASDKAIGAVLLQVQEGQERPIAYASRVLNQAEIGYSVCEKEALAGLYALEHWHYYTYGRKIRLRTDHRALTALLNCSGEGRKPLRLQRWYDRLQQYSFDVEYKKGSTNCVADLLSRSPAAVHNVQDETEVCNDVCSIFGSLNVPLVSEHEIVSATAVDPMLSVIAGYIKHGWPSDVPNDLKPFVSEKDVLSLFKGCVMHSDVVVVPLSLRDRMVMLAHEGHPGIVRTLQRLREAAWWPGMTTHVRGKVASCIACAQNSVRNTTRSTPLIPVEWPTKPWSKIGIDIVGELSDVCESKRFCITVIDYCSKWPEVCFCGSVTSSAVIKFLIELFARWGLAETVVTDNGVQFVSAEFEKFFLGLILSTLKLVSIFHKVMD
jgi:hypothetical protein